MRVTKSQIVHGVTDYIQSDIIPNLANGRGLQIIVSIGANAIAANHKLADVLFENQMFRALLDDDGSGTYDVSGLADAMSKSIEQYGSFPVSIPAIPLISPTEITLKLSVEDVDAMRKRIESAV